MTLRPPDAPSGYRRRLPGLAGIAGGGPPSNAPISDGLRPSPERDHAPPNQQSKLPQFAGYRMVVVVFRTAITECSSSWRLGHQIGIDDLVSRWHTDAA